MRRKAEILPVADAVRTCEPVTATRELAMCPVGNQPLIRAQARRLEDAGFDTTEPATGTTGLMLYASGQAWLSRGLLDKLRTTEHPAVVRDTEGGLLAWLGATREVPPDAACVAPDEDSLFIRYPWDLLRINEGLVGSLSASLVYGEVSARASVEGHVVVGEGTRILPGAFIEGSAIIGRNCKIGPNCYIRGNTSIGDGCHIGNAVEVKNSIVMNRVGIGHLSYCGDSIVGEGTNFGAGSITANFRHDGSPHRSMVEGNLVDTRRAKFGAVIGDGVHLGINTSIYPGRKIWPGISTRPGAVVQKDLLPGG